MWIAVLGASAALVGVALVVVWFGVRVCRAVRRNHDQLVALSRQVECSFSAIAAERLCALLPEETDAAIKRVSQSICYYRSLERGASDEDRERLKRESMDPFTHGLCPAESLLPSHVLGRSLAALRAIKERRHADPKTFSREVSWVYEGKHDALRKRLRETTSASDEPLPVGEGRGHGRGVESKAEGGVS